MRSSLFSQFVVISLTSAIVIAAKACASLRDSSTPGSFLICIYM